MARFYGKVRGGRGEATRLGHKSSGLETVAASWSGAVRTNLFVDENGVDCAEVRLTPWKDRGTSKLLYCGPVSGEVPLARAA